MYKQQKFDEGLKKIQDNIDNVAGLDVVRPQDKEYLQSKLNQLGGQISNMAGGDFSNFSLVNSVNGMTNQIVKDPKVLNAVSSATRYRKDLETINELQSKGEWAPSNQFGFQKDVDRWYNGDASASYNANISPYINVTEEGQKIIKGLAKDEYNKEIMFNPNTGKWLDVMTNQEIKELTPEKIQTALKNGLSPQAYRQLSLDGQYKYSNVSNEAFVDQLNSGYQNRFNMLSERRTTLENVLKNTTRAQDREQIKLQLGQLDNMIEANQMEYNSISSGFSQGDTDSAKAQFYTQDWLENTSEAFSSRSVKSTSKVSPYFDVKYKKDMRAIARERLKAAQKANEIAEKPPVLTGRGITLPEDAKATKNLLNQDREDAINIRKQEILSRDNLSQNMGWDDTIKDKDKLTEFDRQLKIAASNNYENISPSMRDDVRDYLFLEQKAETIDFRNETILQEVLNQIPLDIDELVPEEYVGRTWEGFSAAETAVLLEKFQKYSSTEEVSTGANSAGIPMGYKTTVFDDERAQAELTPQQFALYTNVYRSNRGDENAMAAADMTNQIMGPVGDINDRRKELEDRLKLKAITTDQGVNIPLLIDEKNVKNEVQSILGGIQNYLETSGQGWMGTDLTANDINKIRSSLVDASFNTSNNSLIVSGSEDAEGTEIPLDDRQWSELTDRFGIQVNNTPEVTSFNRNILPRLLSTNPSINEKGFWTTAIPEYKTDPLISDGYLGEVENTSTRSPRYTTRANSYFNNFDFPSIKYLNVTGNLITKENPRENFDRGYMQLNFTLPVIKNGEVVTLSEEGWEYPSPINKSQVEAFLNTLTDEVLFEKYLQRNPDLNDVKLMENQPLNIPQ
ncbi:MAG: hypothetical protein CMJ25_26310 [Phycisphaerae bacterium]|nr:hypothetical protein [Phycisphaerae bacterium]